MPHAGRRRGIPNGYSQDHLQFRHLCGLEHPSAEFRRITGKIVDGALRFHLPRTGSPELAYRFDGETFWAHGESRVSLARVTDLGEVECGSQARDFPWLPRLTDPAIG